MINHRILMIALTVSALALTACGSDSPADDGTGDTVPTSDGQSLSVVVTTTIWGDIVSNVVGDAATVEVLFPVGADAHDYQLSSAQVAAMQQADLVVVNGLNLEEGILDVTESLRSDGANVLEIAPLLDPIALGSGDHADHDDEAPPDECDSDTNHDDEDGADHDEDAGHDDEDADHDDEHADHDDEHAGHAHDEGSCDPHIWMDPLRVADATEVIAGELAALDPSVDWMANATEYAEELRSLDDEVIGLLETVPDDRRKMVTNHEALGYLAARYDFEIVGVVIPGGSTMADPSSAELAELVETMIDENIDVIFGETVEPSALGEAVAAEVGTDVLVVELFTESLGGADSDAATYVAMIRANAARIVDALS